MAKQTFENAIKKLEQIVKELETEDLPLEKALSRFEEGVKLSRFCEKKLDETEQKVAVLLKDTAGNVSETPFDPEKEDEK